MGSSRVLVVDVDRELATWLGQSLAAAGFEARVGFDTPSGLTLADIAPPSLVVADPSLVGPNGHGFVSLLRQRQPSHPIGAVYLLHPEQMGTAVRDGVLGLDDFALKPVHVPSLVERLRRLDLRLGHLPEVVSELGRYVARFAPTQAARRVSVTVMFTDVRGFTSLSESRDPETVAAAINEILDQLAAGVLRFGGIIDKYLGDGMMAIFGADAQNPDHALAAFYAAQDIFDSLAQTQTVSLFTGVELALGIGLHSGEAVIGPVGPAFHREVTAIGDTVNTASRLCQEAKPGELLVSSATYDVVKARAHVLGVRDVFFKGKSFAQRVYAVRLA